MKRGSDAAVLGAGITGCCLALELAARGISVDLIDKAAQPMTGVSLHNEGKLHLGFVYAKDPNRSTHVKLIEGSLAFPHILEELTGVDPKGCFSPSSFHYYVPNDSQLSLVEIENHFDAVQKCIAEQLSGSGDKYLGASANRSFESNTGGRHAALFNPELTLGSFRTVEQSVSTEAVAELLCQAVARTPGIRFIGGATVESVAIASKEQVIVSATKEGLRTDRNYPAVINCLWEDRLRIDQTAGILDSSQWIYRFKTTVRAKRPALVNSRIPSATGILGSYGDVVNHGNGDFYLSWYPICKIAQSVGGDGRDLNTAMHPSAVERMRRALDGNWPWLAGHIAAFAHRGFVRRVIEELAGYIPSLQELLRTKGADRVGGGVIVARGASDIDDRNSGLHARSQIGPSAHGSYFSVDTGKYCMGPLFARQTAAMVEAVLR